MRISYWRLSQRDQVIVELLRTKELYYQSLVENVPLLIYRKDRNLRFTFVNDLWRQHLGLKQTDRVVHKSDRDFFPKEMADKYEADDRQVLETGKMFECTEEHTALGQKTTVRVSKTALLEPKTGAIVGIQGVFWDVTEQHAAMHEIHHRVKNNLQIVSSFIGLQRLRMESSKAADALRACDHRVKTMYLIHEDLCEKKELFRINLDHYINRLANRLLDSYTNGDIALKVTVEPIEVDDKIAFTCGTIVNELISNSIQHAFPDSKSGSLNVTLGLDEQNRLVLTVIDDGIGLPSGFDLNSIQSLGLKLVRDLARGRVALISGPGAGFKVLLDFPGKKHADGERM